MIQAILLPSDFQARATDYPTNLLQSMYALRRAPAERAQLPSFAIESCQPATSSSTELPKLEAESANSHGRQQIDEYFGKDDEPARSRRPSCASASSVYNMFVVHDTRLSNHAEQTEKIEEYLDPLLPLSDAPRNRFVLICWGKSNECHIKSVFFQHTSTEAAIWSSVHHAWSASRSPLHKF